MKWKEMSDIEKIKYAEYVPIGFFVCFVSMVVLSFLNVWAALPFGILSTILILQAEHMKTRKILFDELKGEK